jgi:hypothetical protein
MTQIYSWWMFQSEVVADSGVKVLLVVSGALRAVSAPPAFVARIWTQPKQKWGWKKQD